jgi:ADP-ribose pyrophosphatase
MEESRKGKSPGGAWDDQALTWQEVETEHLAEDQWIDFRRVKYRMPDGSEAAPFYNYSRKDYVVIAARDTEGRFICVRQFRHGIRTCTTEFPAGGIEGEEGHDYALPSKSTVSMEAALEAARRELKEETGYVSDSWRHLITIPSNATIADNYAYVFAAQDCRKAAEPDPDDTEFLGDVLLTEREIEGLIRQGGFQQALHVMAFMMLKAGFCV